ncbi:hypothetical protein M1446_00720 [Candidatus Dependentiae bacterium]|nr:hypothetical protein [Candidatus Dependentiae bacterium]
MKNIIKQIPLIIFLIFLTHLNAAEVANSKKINSIPDIIDPSKTEHKIVQPEDIGQELAQLKKEEEQEFEEKKEIPKKETFPSKQYMADYTKPFDTTEENEFLTLYFEDADLSNLVQFIEKNYKIQFITDDEIKPTPAGGKNVLGNKITFKSHVPMTKKQVWDIFLTFLDMSGLAVVPGPAKNVYRITNTDPKTGGMANKVPLPTYIGTDPNLLPDNDMKIRYVYFIENTSIPVVKSVLEQMRSTTSSPTIEFPDLRAILITDKAGYIKSLMRVIIELDKATMPEMLSVIRLKHADADKVAELYKALTQKGPPESPYGPRPVPHRTPTVSYFSETLRLIPYLQNNSLIALGTREAIARVEKFIKTKIDKELDIPYSPLNIIQLKFIDAETIANILTEATKFQTGTPAAQVGGVRGGEKYFKQVSITPEKSGNRLIIKSDYDDFKKILDLINELDIEQPQVAIRVMIINVDITNQKSLGTQLRDKVPGFSCGTGIPNINFQNTGISTAIQNPTGTGATRLLGNLVALAVGQQAGSTLISFANDIFGVAGFLRILDSITKVSIVANPFLIATHKYPAQISIGETRRVQAAKVVGNTSQDSIEDLPANLKVTLVPLINHDGTVYLDVNVTLEQFTDSDPTSGNRLKKAVSTSALVANNEVLALGGLIRTSTIAEQTKWPILGDIPIIGWLFKDKTKIATKSSILILISPEIIMPSQKEFAEQFTTDKMNESRTLLRSMRRKYEQRDPIYRWFFRDSNQFAKDKELAELDKFANKKGRYLDERFFVEEGTSPIDQERLPETTPAPVPIEHVEKIVEIKNSNKKRRLSDLINGKEEPAPEALVC